MAREAWCILHGDDADRLGDMMQKLRMPESESRARILLRDMSVLRAWQQQSKEKRGASNATRDSMLKVGTRWSVQGKPCAPLAGKLSRLPTGRRCSTPKLMNKAVALHNLHHPRAGPRRSLDVPSTPRLGHRVVDLLRDLEPCTFPSAACVHWRFRQDP